VFEKTLYQPICNLTPLYYERTIEDKKYETRPIFQEGYQRFWQEFQTEFDAEIQGNFDLTTIYHLFKKYLWCIPSSYWKNHPDISLFEHSRLAAAIAVCLFDFLENQCDGDWSKIPPKEVKEGENARYLLTVADLSGIQDFLYNIAHSGALRALKGRSYFLQQIMDAAARQILKRLDLFEANLLYSSGGKFYLLLPNTDKAIETISKVEEEINNHLLETYHGELAVIFANKALSKKDFQPGEISARWDELNKDLERNKLRRFSARMGDVDFFKPDENEIPFGNVELCYATNVELEGKDIFEDNKRQLGSKGLFYNLLVTHGKQFFEITDEIDGTEIRDNTGNWIHSEQYESQIIGQKLKKEPVASVIMKPSTKEVANLNKPVSVFNWEKFDLIKEKDYSLDIPPGIEKAYLFNDDNFLSLPIEAKGWKFYAGNWHPEKNNGDAADFSDLAASAIGLKRLAVLRMDVDNLGRIFREGINDDGKRDEKGKLKSTAPFSRIVQLSNMLDFFFSGFLNKLKDLYWSPYEGVHSDPGLPGAEKLRNALQIIYAGGDDLCIVGKWNVMPDVALWIHDRFDEFTGGNPSVNLSAGIALFGEKYPLFKVAEIAGEAEDRSKGHPGKNAICFLDHVSTWEEFRLISKHAKEFWKWSTTGIEHQETKVLEKMPSSFLHVIQELYSEFSNATPMRRLTEKMIENNRYGRWRWRGAYRLHRVGMFNKAYREELDKLAAQLFLNFNQGVPCESDFLLILYTASQWADFLTRKSENHE